MRAHTPSDSILPTNVTLYRALVIAKALELRAKGIQVNSAYTPTVMLRAAQALTGTKYKRGEFERAARDIRDVVESFTKG